MEKSRGHLVGGGAVEGDRRHVLREFWQFALGFYRSVPRAALTWAAALVVVASLAEGIGLAFLAPLIGLLGDGKPQGAMASLAVRLLGAFGLPLSLSVLVATFVALVSIRAILASRRDVALECLKAAFIERLRLRLYDAITQAEWSFVAAQRISNLAKALTIDSESVGHGTYYFIQLPALIVLAFVQLAVAFALAPLPTLAALVCGAVISGVVWRWRRNTYEAGQLYATAQQSAFNEMSDCLTALKLAKSHDAGTYNRQLFSTAEAAQHAHYLALMGRNSEAQMIIQVCATVALGAFVYVGSSAFGLAAPQLLVLILIFARLMPTLADIQNSGNVIQLMLPVHRHLMQLLSAAVAAHEHLPSPGSERLTVCSEIGISGLRFRYDKVRGPDVLHDLNLTIPARAIVAISGASGVGKSTLADIMLGLLVPDSGTVSIDGRPLNAQRLSAWRRSVAYVPQDNVLFNQTVRANLLWGSHDAADAEVVAVLAQTGMNRLIETMPQGIDTVIGERGSRLSGGERQRLSLARALLRRPTLLILDEATNALDQDSERAVWKVLEDLRRTATVIIIAHRESTLRRADFVAVIEGGSVSHFGRRKDALDCVNPVDHVGN
jgi:ATP-binding cassette subfamily C protein